MLLDSLNNAIIGIRAGMRALQSLPPFILGQAQRQPVLVTQLLKFCNGALGNDGDALGVQQIHQTWQHLDLRADGVREEVRVEEDVVRRAERLVCLEE